MLLPLDTPFGPLDELLPADLLLLLPPPELLLFLVSDFTSIPLVLSLDKLLRLHLVEELSLLLMTKITN